jgi:hypothetical protein
MEATMDEVGSLDMGTKRYVRRDSFRCTARRASIGPSLPRTAAPAPRRARAASAAALFLALASLAACDTPTEPKAIDGEQEMVDLAYTLGLSTSPFGATHTINVNGTLYDIGCPMQCWLPGGIVALVDQMVANGTLRIIWSSPPAVYVAGTKTPVLLQNGRSVPKPPACSNGLDDDGDGYIDWPSDPGCDSPTDDNEFDTVPVIETSPPVITVPSYIRGTTPFKGMKQWTVTCPVRGTLTSTDHRTWTALGLLLMIDYVRFVAGSGWMVTESETISLIDDAAAAGSLLGAGLSHTLRLSNHEARIRISVLARGDDGEELLVHANDGGVIFCGL